MLNGEEMEETEIPGLTADQQTFFLRKCRKRFRFANHDR
jgi:hypothetical protein